MEYRFADQVIQHNLDLLFIRHAGWVDATLPAMTSNVSRNSFFITPCMNLSVLTLL
jgi:hypothetical protein